MNDMQKTAVRVTIVLAIVLLFASACRPEPTPPTSATYTIATESTTRPTTALDASGMATFVAWITKEDSLSNVYLSRMDQSGAEGFAQPVRVNDVPGDATGHQQAPAQVTVAPDGTVYVAWITQTIVPGRRFPASDIRLARSTDGGRTFEPAITVNEDSGYPTGHHFHNLAVGPDGTVYVSWLDTRERDKARASQPAQDTGSPATHTSGRAGNGAHGGRGAHGHHGDDELTGTQVRVARSTNGGRTFEPSIVVAEGTCQCCRTALTISENGTVYVAWRHVFGGITRDMAIARSEDRGQSFSKPVRIHADGWAIDGCPHSGPAITVEGERTVHVAWYTGAPDKAGLYYAVSHDGGASFEPAQELVKDVPVAQASVTTAEEGGAWIAYENPDTKCICLRRADRKGIVQTAALDTQPGSGPTITSANGTRVLAWRDGKAIRVRVMQGGV